MNTLQIIIPVYQDREALELLLPALLKQSWSANQITVVDAGEQDAYPLNNEWEVQVIHPPSGERGRAKQMNMGAAQSESRILLFLHADTFLPVEAPEMILDAVAQGYVGGGFSRRFDSPSRFLRFTCMLADWRAKNFGWYFGDQAIFCVREVFEQLGGYPDIFPFEDLAFSRKLKKAGRLKLLKPGIRTSARRFEKEGPFRRTFKDLGLTLRYFMHH